MKYPNNLDNCAFYIIIHPPPLAVLPTERDLFEKTKVSFIFLLMIKMIGWIEQVLKD